MDVYINGVNLDIVLTEKKEIIPVLKNNQEKTKEIINGIGKSAKVGYIGSSGIRWMSGAGMIGLDSGFDKIVVMFQDFAFYIGLGYAIWGVIEYILERPGATEKIKKAIYGYVGVNVLPMIFKTIRNAFHGM